MNQKINSNTDVRLQTKPDQKINPEEEERAAKRLSERYRCEYVDLRNSAIDPELFRTIPAELMFRYNFVPLKSLNGSLLIAIADPSELLLTDELGELLGKKIVVRVATGSQISDILKKSESSQRVLEEVTEGFTLDVVGDDENQDETLSIDKLTAIDNDIAPVIKLVDTTIFNALGYDPSAITYESAEGRPLALSEGELIKGIL